MKKFWKKDAEETLAEKLKYKIRALHKDHSFTINLTATVKKGLMIDLYKGMAKRFPGEKREFDELETDSFALPENYVGILHGKLKKVYSEIEKETNKDFLQQGKRFRFTIIKTLSCEYLKKNKDEYDVVVKTEGYWSS